MFKIPNYFIAFFFLLLLSLTLSADSEYFPRGIGCTKFPGYPLCSGAGVCLDTNTSVRVYDANVPGTRCICDAGWTGVGDLMNMDGTDCQQNIQAGRGLFGLAIVISLVTFFLSLHRLYFSYKSFASNVRAGVRRPSGPRLSRHSLVTPLRNRTQLCASFLRINVVPLAIMCLISSIGTLTYGAVRITDPANPEWVLGNSMVTTISRIAETAFFFSSSSYFSHSWMTMSILMCAVTGKTKEEAREAVVHMKRILIWCIIIGSFLNPFFVLFIHLFQDMRIDGILTVAYSQSAGVVGLFSTIAVFHTGRVLVEILSKGLECLPQEGQLQRMQVIGKIKARFRISLCTTTCTMTLCTAVAWWPNLRTKITWILPIVSFINQLILSVSLLTLKPPQVQQKPTSSYSDEERDNGPARPSLEMKKKKAKATSPRKAATTKSASTTKSINDSNGTTGDSSPLSSIASPSGDGPSSDGPTESNIEVPKEVTEDPNDGTMVLDVQDEIDVDPSVESPAASRIELTGSEYARLSEGSISHIAPESGSGSGGGGSSTNSSITQNTTTHTHTDSLSTTPPHSRQVSDFGLFDNVY